MGRLWVRVPRLPLKKLPVVSCPLSVVWKRSSLSSTDNWAPTTDDCSQSRGLAAKAAPLQGDERGFESHRDHCGKSEIRNQKSERKCEIRLARC